MVYHVNSLSDIVMSDGQTTPPAEVTTDPSEDKPQGRFWRCQCTDTFANYSRL
jgi:hypothetical protein